MSVQIESVSYHAGAPKWLGSYRYAAYHIHGRGFGTEPGIVTIDGEAQRVVEWSPDSILIAQSDRDPYWNQCRPPGRDRDKGHGAATGR